ncbi:MAG: protease complex subunit PrcB family protein [Clostridiales bacterium]|nr:protease complex subunit PrcB family protein [Clostridiales bacterium]
MSKKYKGLQSLNKKTVSRIIIVILAVLALGAACFSLFGGTDGEAVTFRILSESEIPQQMVSQVIPEYRQLERALACLIDGKVYVLATRGEKASNGYGITIRSMELKETDAGCTLIVQADFTDPAPGITVNQAITYPLQVAETDLTELPQEIELKVKYAD